MIGRYRYTDGELKNLLKSLTVIVDTRERANSHIIGYFEKHKIPYIERNLEVFDYSFYLPENKELGIYKDLYFDKEILFERKANLDELAANLTKHRARFEEEMCTAKAQQKYLIIENASYQDVVNGNYQSEYGNKSYLGTLHSFNHKYSLQILFMPDPTYTPMFLYWTMQYYLRNTLK